MLLSRSPLAMGPRVIFLLDGDSERPLTSGSILFEDREEHNELGITLSGTSVTDGPLVDSALNPWCSLLTWDSFANPTRGVSDTIGHTAIGQCTCATFRTSFFMTDVLKTVTNDLLPATTI